MNSDLDGSVRGINPVGLAAICENWWVWPLCEAASDTKTTKAKRSKSWMGTSERSVQQFYQLPQLK